MRGQGIALGLVVGGAVGLVAGIRFKDPLLSAVSGPLPTPTIVAVNLTTLEAVIRAATTLQQSLAVGVTLAGLGERLQGLATEIALASNAIQTEQERDILRQFFEAQETYRQGYDLWRESVERDKEFLFISPDIVARYGIPESMSTVGSPDVPELGRRFPELSRRFEVNKVNQFLWTLAGHRVSAALESIRAARTS